MIASSTSAPIAIVRPPSVIVLSVTPRQSSTMIATSSDSGIETSEINVVRRSNRNRNRITATRIAPSRREIVTLPTAVSMKSAWRTLLRSTFMPSGNVFSISPSSRSIRPVSSSVFAPGCFWIAITTAGFPLDEPSPRGILGPTSTLATCPTRMGDPSRTSITACSISSFDVIRPTPRISDSCPPRTKNPPVEFAFDSRSASSTPASVTLNARSRSGSTRTWYWRTPPPIGTTCATPGSASNRRRTTQSAVSRTSMGLWRSLTTATNRISPMIDAIGARLGGLMSGGICEATSWSFSFTI